MSNTRVEVFPYPVSPCMSPCTMSHMHVKAVLGLDAGAVTDKLGLDQFCGEKIYQYTQTLRHVAVCRV